MDHFVVMHAVRNKRPHGYAELCAALPESTWIEEEMARQEVISIIERRWYGAEVFHRLRPSFYERALHGQPGLGVGAIHLGPVSSAIASMAHNATLWDFNPVFFAVDAHNSNAMSTCVYIWKCEHRSIPSDEHWAAR